MKYLKRFDTHSQYEAYMGGGDAWLANLSYCAQQDEVHFNSLIQRIEYLESSGEQYIDTNVNGASISQFIVKGMCTPASNYNTQLLGGTSQEFTSFFGARSLSGTFWYCRDSSKNSLGDPRHVSIINATILSNTSQIGVLQDTETSSSYDFVSFADTWAFPSENLLLFGGHNDRKSPRAKCYYLQLYANGVLVKNFVPVRIGDVGYMYDKVSKQLFENSGNGNFILGPDI